MNWSELPMSEKSRLMRIYLENGISSLDDMKNHYNTYQKGGRLTFEQEGPWSYDALVQTYKEFLDRGKYFPKKNRDANHLLRCKGKDMLGMSDEYIEEIIKNNCAEAFVGKMVKIELWR